MTNDIPAASREAVKIRSGNVCEFCLQAPATDVAHRVPRNRRIHRPENLLHLCREHHAWCHSYPAKATRRGLVLPANGRITADDLRVLPFQNNAGVWRLLRSYTIGRTLHSYTIPIHTATAIETLESFGISQLVSV